MILTVVLAVTGCNRKTVYHHYVHTPNVGWEKIDTLFFDVPPVDHSAVLSEEIGLRISHLYPFLGLSLIVQQKVIPADGSDNRSIVRTDTLNCSFYDKDGTPMGKGIGYYQYSFHLTDLSVSEKDSLHIAVRHNMRCEILQGIVDVGILLRQY
jgi:gliding motility-associated lipoprotein GldH